MFGGECGYCVVDSSRLFSLMTFFKCYYTVGNFVCYVCLICCVWGVFCGLVVIALGGFWCCCCVFLVRVVVDERVCC